MAVRIERATAEDGDAILQLLAASGLPIAGVLDHLNTAVVARRGGRIVGCAALEIYPDGALLRSVAVDPALKGQTIGTQLTSSALELASSLGMSAVFLLTTTAEGFFPRFAFSPTTRDAVPSSVRTSVEFRSACPSTAVVMRKVLARNA